MKMPDDAATAEPQIVSIAHARLVPWSAQPRRNFDAGELMELRQSMLEHGFMQAFPLYVRPKMRVVKRTGNDPEHPDEWCVEERTDGGNWREVTVEDTEEKAEAFVARETLYEIIDGERRYRTAGEESITMLPCIVEEMSDGKALEVALVSSLRKVGLNPMEVAEGYRRLLDLRDERGQVMNTEETIAKKIGTSRMNVRHMLILCNLRGTSAAAVIATGELSPSHGRLLGKLPTVELREEWTKKVMSNPWGPSPMPRAQLEQRLQEDVMKELRGADFNSNDPDLVPMVVNEGTGARLMGGACTDCPFNTRNIEAEDDEVKGRRHMCMHPVCFRAKTTATYDRWVVDHAKPEKGITALTKVENDKLWADSGTVLAFNSPYVDLDEKPPEIDLKPAANNASVWKELVKGQSVPMIVARDLKGATHKLVKHELAVSAAVANKHRIFKADPEEEAVQQQSASPAGSSGIPAVDAAAASMQREAAADEQKAANETKALEDERVHIAAVAALVEAIETSRQPQTAVLRVVFERFSEMLLDGLSLAAERRGVASEAFHKSIVKDNPDAWLAALVELSIHENFWANGFAASQEEMKDFAKAAGVDLKKIEKAVRQQFQEELAAKVEEAALKDGMVWKQVRPEQGGDYAAAFEFNSAQIAENPERCELEFPKAMKITASVSLAYVAEKGGWVMGYFVQGPKFGNSGPAAANGTIYTRAAALRAGLLAIVQVMQTQNGATIAAQERVQGWIAGLGEPPKPPKEKKSKQEVTKGTEGKAKGGSKKGGKK